LLFSTSAFTALPQGGQSHQHSAKPVPQGGRVMLLQLSSHLALALWLMFSQGSVARAGSLVINQPSPLSQQAAPRSGDAPARERAEELLKAGRELREKATGKDDRLSSQQKLEEAVRLYQSLNDRRGEAEA